MIYVLRFENQKRGYFKVGISTNLPLRISDIQTACPFKLALIALRPGHRKEEKALHKQMEKFRTNGEWFQDVPLTRESLNISKPLPVVFKGSPLNSVLSFMEANADYSFDSKMICEVFGLDYYKLQELYHGHKGNSPVRIEALYREDLERINYVGTSADKHVSVISHVDNFNAQLGGYERFNAYHSRITPFNKKLVPKKWLEPKYPYTYFNTIEDYPQ